MITVVTSHESLDLRGKVEAGDSEECRKEKL